MRNYLEIVQRKLLSLGLLVGLLVLSNFLKANHLVGGELTWACLGSGQYIFQVKVYQDCNEFQPPPTSMQIRVWNNSNLSIIPLSNIGNNDFSFSCSEVTGGSPQYDCSAPGVGSITEYILQSAPLTLTGVPPASGWHFTWDAYFRTGAAQNLENAQNAGLTLHASMYSYNGQDASTCFDSSPEFIKPPLNVVCSSKNINYNIGAFDSNLDSISYQFANPLNNDFGSSFSPPTSPSVVQWAAGYNTTSQLPGQTQNSLNSGAVLNPNNGALTFNSITLGNFSTVIKVESWRCGQLIAVVYREMLINIISCPGSNNAPTISLSGITNNAITVNAGDLVSFDIIAQDNDLLADGTSQSVTLNVFGGEVGDGLTNPNLGCPYTPCAITNTGLPQTNTQSVNSTFSWETSCSLFTEDCYRPNKIFYFTVVAQDDYCSVPGQNEVTVAVKVVNKSPIAPPILHCANVALNGDVTLNWEPTVDVNNSFQEYRIYSSNNTNYNLVGTANNINTTTFTHVGADANVAPVNYIVKSVYGCNNSESIVLDTLTTLFLEVNNPSDGTAVLQWNQMSNPPLNSASDWYYIYLEYPTGTWTLLDSTQYGNEYYRDTISVCDAFLNYKIELKDQLGCSSFSNVAGDQFQDLLPPNLPNLNWVTVDTASGNAALNWFPSSSGDASAYIIFQFFGGGWIAVDTVQGYNSTNYTYLNSNADEYSETYALAVYDSCFSPTPNTSPLGVGQETMFLTLKLEVCDKSVELNWNSYKNWNDGVDRYEIEASVNGGVYTVVGSTTDTTFNFTSGVPNANYCFLIKAVANDQFKTSLSSLSCLFLHQPPSPMFNYLQTVTVLDANEIEVRIHQDLAAQISNFRLERSLDNINTNFEEVLTTTSANNPVIFNDVSVETNETSYFYRVLIEDSCGRPTLISNIGKSILLDVSGNSTNLTNLLQWTPYQKWNGNLLRYEIFRSINGVFSSTPIAVLPPSKLFYNDDISGIVNTGVDGDFCYFIRAVESSNTFGVNEISESNVSCAQQNPIVYIPNALVIGGYNNTWRPVISLINYDTYQVRVFNRFSEIIFESNDPNEAWNGGHKKNGKIVQQGLYIYQITFRKSNGDFEEVRGHITLMK
jgi:gliding motility-associated-like protein